MGWRIDWICPRGQVLSKNFTPEKAITKMRKMLFHRRDIDHHNTLQPKQKEDCEDSSDTSIKTLQQGPKSKCSGPMMVPSEFHLGYFDLTPGLLDMKPVAQVVVQSNASLVRRVPKGMGHSSNALPPNEGHLLLLQLDLCWPKEGHQYPIQAAPHVSHLKDQCVVSLDSTLFLRAEKQPVRIHLFADGAMSVSNFDIVAMSMRGISPRAEAVLLPQQHTDPEVQADIDLLLGEDRGAAWQFIVQWRAAAIEQLKLQYKLWRQMEEGRYGTKVFHLKSTDTHETEDIEIGEWDGFDD
ncbi:predicted protein [Uncinocarpus reesii 1704]|uniref:Uncharacterized protein n=1 Tax=Uncinocarpus reesii (strain UAMH 1704) TaxID=336963 RepID=C4JVR5_UNCRE|nr:uncharacterized protein UREG_06657 [Uncinocarpus reesii 1704]EEP81792.1 predicted protein [Uncinocarpus reesii 1704]